MFQQQGFEAEFPTYHHCCYHCIFLPWNPLERNNYSIVNFLLLSSNLRFFHPVIMPSFLTCFVIVVVRSTSTRCMVVAMIQTAIAAPTPPACHRRHGMLPNIRLPRRPWVMQVKQQLSWDKNCRSGPAAYGCNW